MAATGSCCWGPHGLTTGAFFGAGTAASCSCGAVADFVNDVVVAVVAAIVLVPDGNGGNAFGSSNGDGDCRLL